MTLSHYLAEYGLLMVFAINFISSMGIPAGSEWATLGAGVYASGKVKAWDKYNHGHPSFGLLTLILVAAAADILGSTTGYLLGRYAGRPLVDKFGKYLLITHKDLDRTEAWFARRGELVVIFGRVVPLLRSFIAFVAGLGEMAMAKFVAYVVIGTVLFAPTLCVLGYALGSVGNTVLEGFSYAGYVLAALLVVGVVLVITHRVRSMREAADS